MLREGVILVSGVNVSYHKEHDYMWFRVRSEWIPRYSAAFHLGLHCLQKICLGVSRLSILLFLGFIFNLSYKTFDTLNFLNIVLAYFMF